MSGLEKLTTHILEDAKKQSLQEINLAEKHCFELLEQAEKDALKEYDEIILKAKKDACLKKERKISDTQSSLIDKKLEIKVNSINSVLEKAKNKIINSDDETYNKIFISFLNRCQLKEGTLFLNSADLKRLNKTAKNIIDAYTVNTDDTLKGGFLIACGRVLENYSLDDIFQSKKDELWDLVSSILFV